MTAAQPPTRQSQGHSTAAPGNAPPPLYAAADFCLIPFGTGSSSVGAEIAEVQRVLESFTPQGLIYKLHGYGTNLEGPWPLVSRAIEACHERLHELGVPRIATDIRIGTKRPTPDAAPPAGGENARKQASVVHRLAAATATAHDGVPDSTPQEHA